MKRYISASQTGLLMDIEDFFDMLDSYINDDTAVVATNATVSESPRSVNKIMITTQFEKNLKVLHKQHRIDVIAKLKDTIEKLCRFEVTIQSKNHKLTNQNNPNRLSDIHLAGDVILLYRYIVTDILTVDLELTNITDHKTLDKAMGRKHNAISKEVDYTDSAISEVVDK